VQVVSLRLVIAGETPKPRMRRIAAAAGAPVPEATVRAFLEGAWQQVPLYARGSLGAGQAFSGPAIVAQPDCTTCIPAGFSTLVDGFGNLVITPEAR
jgi:N-methylhydantoinase A